MSSDLQIWYLAPLRKCNLNCSYCATGQPNIKDKDMWQRGTDLDHHQRILDWIASLDQRVSLRVNTIGEPFISDDYLSSIAQLSHSENVNYIELLTNGTFTKNRFDKFIIQAQASKITLWMTFHHESVSVKKLVENALYAKEKGAVVFLHGLIFPDSADKISELKKACEENNLDLHVGLGLNLNNAYETDEFVPALADNFIDKIDQELMQMNVAFSDELYKRAQTPLGAKCTAGFNYLYLNYDGSIYRCFTYSNDPTKRPMGNVLDEGFKLKLNELKYTACRSLRRCMCTEDFQHIDLAWEHIEKESQSFIPTKKSEIKSK